MRVLPTLEGGLRIEVQTAADWLVLEQIAPDALVGGPDHLPEQLGVLMDDESQWADLVIPELREFFSGQLKHVAETVREAQRGASQGEEAPAGDVFIRREAGADWYGALNQARLALESRYRFGGLQGGADLEMFPEAKRSAFLRSQFYCALQGILLEHVLD